MQNKIYFSLEYLRNLCRYIHQDPNKAGIADMEDYQWSSYQEYVEESKIIDRNGQKIE